MKKILSALLIAILLVMSTTIAFAAPTDTAASAPGKASTAWTAHTGSKAHAPSGAVLFEKKITLTKKGGSVNVGFVTLQFPKNCLPGDMLPRELTIQVFASGDTGVVSVSPDTEGFLSPVRISVHAYKGWLFDELSGFNKLVQYAPTSFYVDHFSRYCWH